jgi:FtsH-binding integral membrane protein
MLTRNRFGLYAAATLFVFIVSIINAIFFGYLMLELIIGITLGALYVIIDTQIMISKAEMGRYDIWTDAKELFIDLFKLFIEISKILAKKSKDKE